MNALERYRQTAFVTSVSQPSQLPPDRGLEVAFAGRSNSGKSSALNALTGRQALARVSKTPGRTRMINFFRIAEDRHLVAPGALGQLRPGILLGGGRWGEARQAAADQQQRQQAGRPAPGHHVGTRTATLCIELLR